MNLSQKGTLLILALASSEALAGDGQALPDVVGDVEYGEYLSAECVTCHNISAAGNDIPSLNGWSPSHLAQVLRAYKAKQLENPTMQTVAARLNDEQIASLALYFSTLEAPDQNADK